MEYLAKFRNIGDLSVLKEEDQTPVKHEPSLQTRSVCWICHLMCGSYKEDEKLNPGVYSVESTSDEEMLLAKTDWTRWYRLGTFCFVVPFSKATRLK